MKTPTIILIISTSFLISGLMSAEGILYVVHDSHSGYSYAQPSINVSYIIFYFIATSSPAWQWQLCVIDMLTLTISVPLCNYNVLCVNRKMHV